MLKMGADTKIQWCDFTFNPWLGCSKVSPGCYRCYAEEWDKRFHGGIHWGKGALRRRTSASNWHQPLKWNAEAPSAGQRPRVFCASLADWLDAEVDPKWRHDLLNVIRATPNLDWLLLTKRPENFVRLLMQTHKFAEDYDLRSWAWDWVHGAPPANVWMGTTVEDQARANQRIPILARIPAKIRFLSCEPLLEPISLHLGDMEEIHWVICGGESGPDARPMDIEWARSLEAQCIFRTPRVPFFMKQLGGESDKRGELADFPEDLREREFPK